MTVAIANVSWNRFHVMRCIIVFVQFPESNASTMRLAHSCWQGGDQFVSAPVLPSGLLARC